MEVVPALNHEPVFIDGLSTPLSYVILAVKQGPEYNCVCLRNNGTFKFYPNFEFWGLTEGQLHGLGLNSTYDRDDYQGVRHVTSSEVSKVLNIIRGQRGAAVVPDHLLIAGVFETPANQRGRSRALHPETQGRAPVKLLSFDQVLKLAPPQDTAPLPLPQLAFAG